MTTTIKGQMNQNFVKSNSELTNRTVRITDIHTKEMRHSFRVIGEGGSMSLGKGLRTEKERLHKGIFLRTEW